MAARSAPRTTMCGTIGMARDRRSAARGRLERSCAYHRRVATEQVRMWRPPGEERILLMAGRTVRYSIEPRGEYVFGVVARRPMRSLRGRERRLVRPGELVAWDPSGAHGGVALDSEPWSARLMVVEIAALDAIAGDQESDLPPTSPSPSPSCLTRCW